MGCRPWAEHSPLLGMFSYLPNGGLGWVISEGSEDLVYSQWPKRARSWAGGLTREPDSRDHQAQGLPRFQTEGKLRPQRVSDQYSVPNSILGLHFKANWGLLPSVVS